MAKCKAKEWLQEDKLVLLEAWARDGFIDKDFAEKMDISLSTFYEWKKKYSEFSEAIKKGKEIVDIEVENALLKNAKGFYYPEEVVASKKEVIYENGKRVKEVVDPVVITINKFKPSETAAAIFWLKNRKPNVWRDKQEKVNNNNTINDNILNIANLINNPQPNRGENDV